MDLWPFRKRKIIYQFDDNWEPLSISTYALSTSPTIIDYPMPNDYYSTIISLRLNLTLDLGIGNTAIRGAIYRGTNIILDLNDDNATQIKPNPIWRYWPAITVSSGGGATDPQQRLTIPSDFALLPGDRIYLYHLNTTNNPRNFNMTLYLKAYYF